MTTLLLTIHLLCVNLASAGPLVCMYHQWREARGQLAAGRVGRSLARWSIGALLAGAATGVALGWLVWDVELDAAILQLRRKVFFGVLEIGFSLVLMIVLVLWWRGPESRWRPARQAVLLLAGTNLLYHFPTLFAVLAHLQTLAPSREVVTAAEFRGLLAQPGVLAYALHVTLASFAVTGAFLIWRSDRGPEDEAPLAKPAARLALFATLLQVPAGFWLTMSVPPSQMKRLMGGDPLATAAFVASLLLALSLMHHLAAVSFRSDAAPSRRWSVWLMTAVVALMTVALTFSRG